MAIKIIREIKTINNTVSDLKKQGKRIGFVPTMGALHKGHISLVENSKKENDITVVSIFVNPTQFNNKTDLKKYPRNEKQDTRMLENAGCDYVFAPSVNEMYPKNETQKTFDFGQLATVMEGKHRPGHFDGVGQIVYKLFKAVCPDNAYFGIKDFQQLAIINYMVKNYMPDSGIKITGCDIVREADGLAMSSRNERLSENQRKSAGMINQIMKKYHSQASNNDIEKIKSSIIYEINEIDHLKVEYYDIVNNETLQPTEKADSNARGCIAVFCDDVRLIDNMPFS